VLPDVSDVSAQLALGFEVKRAQSCLLARPQLSMRKAYWGA